MPAIGMPGFFEWIIILIFLAAIVGGVVLVVRVIRGDVPPRRGFDVEPRPRDSDRDLPPGR